MAVLTHRSPPLTPRYSLTLAVTRGILPFRQFVLKVHSRCDLACDHCYVYEHADQSWRGRPKVIASDTVAKVSERIAEHARQHALSGVRVVMHGGEPLLAGASRLGEIAQQLRAAIVPVCPLDLRIHTNGMRLDEDLCDLFRAERVKVGISLDGDQAANDLHRRFADGRSSYDRVVRAVDLLRRPAYREIYAGLLCTIDLRSDPVAAYRALAALDPPAVDFLLPHGTWDSPPPGVGDGRMLYADWLARVYDTWAADPRRVQVRMFDSIIRTTLGGSSLTEALGLGASDLVVVETDGTIEQADSIKVAYDGAPATGLNVFSHDLNAAAAHPAIKARQQGIAGLSATCRQCPVVSSCGGGLYAHRYRSGNGFENPSVYCADLEKIITHVRGRLRPSAATSARRPMAHVLPGGEFDTFAAGYGDRAAMTHLIKAEQSALRALLRLLRERADGPGNELFLTGWRLIAELDNDGAPAVNEVLAHPYVRVWAEKCLRAETLSASDGAARPLLAGAAEMSHLASIAAAVAIRAGALTELEVPVMAGHLNLPTLGRLRVGAARIATVAADATGFEVRAPSGKWRVDVGDLDSVPEWEPVRDLRAGGVSVRLEDTDPYRDCHQWSAAPRLSAADVVAWQEQFTVAWDLIERDYPNYAPGLAAGLSTIMPLANDVPGREISAAARPAFGSVAAALPADGGMLALLLIHEFQHVKLGGVLDLFDLYEVASGQLFHAPWRDDLRPIGPFLQGTYAHLGVADYWRVRRHQLDGEAATVATEQFARWRLLTAEAIETLAGADVLTALGARFVDGMRATIEPWLAEPVPAAAVAAARRWAADRREMWQPHRGVLATNGRGQRRTRSWVR
jgi:uncharacterized protein